MCFLGAKYAKMRLRQPRTLLEKLTVLSQTAYLDLRGLLLRGREHRGRQCRAWGWKGKNGPGQERENG